MYKIYLSGGMTGLSKENRTAWRQSVKNEITQYVREDMIEFFDPTEHDATEYIENTKEAELVSMKIDLRNLLDSNLVICNVSTNPLSVGTNIELGVCHNLKIPVITFNPDNTPMHPWQEFISEFVIKDLEVLADLVSNYYLPANMFK